MPKTKLLAVILALACLALLPSALFAGGPLLVDPATKSAYHYGPEPVPVYYDLGPLATLCDYSTYPCTPVTLGNAVGRKLVEKGFGDWSNVPTASLRANVAGNFSLLGLPDINATNITDIIGTSNGRGIYVVFDADGSIMENFFGVSNNVLGISSPQYAIAGTTIITESWTVLNGQAVSPQDKSGAWFQGVATHEFGHSLGMAHTQTNGSAYFYGDNVGPNSCGSLPYATNLTGADVETMYPYINPVPGGTGKAQANLHVTDTLAAFSDLYPGPGWPGMYGTISGKVYDIDGKTELTGVNVIARNLADPFADATSYETGQLTQGTLGPDGSFVLHGLKPGAQYVVYVDAIVSGGFPTEPLWFLPGAEKFYRSVAQNVSYNPCVYAPIAATQGKTVTANIKFDQVPGAPTLYQLGPGTGVSGLSGDGNTAVGDYGVGSPIFTWTAKTGVVPMNFTSAGFGASISHNGKYIAGNLFDGNRYGAIGGYRWDAANGWLPTASPGSCGGATGAAFAVDDGGSVYGYAYNNCTDYHASRWNPKTGTVMFGSELTKTDGSKANSRVDHVSADGSIAAGWQEIWWGGWVGTVWKNGHPSTILDGNGDIVGEAYTVSSDGSMLAGGLFDGQYPFDGSGWRRPTNDTTLEYFKPLNADASPANPYALSGDGSVMAGFSGSPWFSFNPAPFLWTEQLGTVDLNDFVRRQGTSMEQWYSLWTPTAISDDGTTIAGWGVGFQSYGGWVLKMKSAFVCHALPNPGRPVMQTLSVPFPKEFDQRLKAGDVPGRCPDSLTP